MYKDLFTSLGLSANESIVYEFLLKNGESSAGAIIKKTPLKRGVIYNTLEELAKKDLITEQRMAKIKGGGKISYFTPNHPQKLEEYLESEKIRLEKVQRTLDISLPSIVSDFNLISGKPGVKFYEGIGGIKKVLADSLTAKSTIYSYADLEAVVTHIDKINRAYVKKRDELGLKKKVIFIDSSFARKYLKNYHRETTYMKFIDHKLYPFNSVMQMYDEKISYITLSKTSKIGVIIEDKNIYQMHKSLFEYTWSKAESLV
jgi:sugar-specific transcriptional regulator TrmB